MVLCALAAAGCATRADAPSPEWLEVWVLRDRRAHAEQIASHLDADDPEVRARAAQALGATRDPLAAEALGRALEDPERWVRYEAAFALGQLRGRTHADLLLPCLEDDDPNLRLLVVGALGKVGRAEHLAVALRRLTDAEAAVRGAAALAVVGLAGDRIRGRDAAPGVDAAHRGRCVAALTTAFDTEPSPTARWRVVYALAHLVEPAARPVLLRAAGEPARTREPRDARFARLFAIRGLSALPPDDATRTALLAQLDDHSSNIVLEAVVALSDPSRQLDLERRDAPGLAYPGTQVGLELTALGRSHRSAHVRAAALRGLGRATRGQDSLEPLLVDALEDPSTTVRCAAIGALARMRGVDARAHIERTIADPDPLVRAAAARAAGGLPSSAALAILRDRVGDPDVRVRTAVAAALADSDGSPDVAELLTRLATERDAAVREAVATSARSLDRRELAPVLRTAYRDSPGAAFDEARKQLVGAVAALGAADPNVEAWLREALLDPSIVVRREALRRLRDRGVELDGAAAAAATRADEVVTPLPGQDIPLGFLQRQPRLRFVTTRGSFEVTLIPRMAPIHCFNLISLAESGRYAGRTFHRVVPNFVVQGGDARGDGYGAEAWHGGRVRDEINPMPFVEGVVGMPKTADDDTGGDQFFVTTVPTPHLDGRYTAFGRVTSGLDVAEAIEVGDVIEEIVNLDG